MVFRGLLEKEKLPRQLKSFKTDLNKMEREAWMDKIDEAKSNEEENLSLVKSLKKMKPKKLDGLIHEAHDAAFRNFDCLTCANCCKTTSPIIKDRDIEKLAKGLKMKPQTLIETYLRIDEDGDTVLQSTPCPFLDLDNYCSVYKFRPQACKEYPHTNRKRMYQILNLTQKNSMICPAVADIFEDIKGQKVSR